ncbi:MAG TPA: hypothetical protein VK604_03060 [Bryobacteraceae bacterium]|nr:hypothetical protein [Bryobacteraceae bacterium]
MLDPPKLPNKRTKKKKTEMIHQSLAVTLPARSVDVSRYLVI